MDVSHPEPSHSVKLYAYDLSNGLARSMSLAWAGRQFDAIWHTSVVYDDQVEVFFGQGIMTCQPGQSHHGTPIKIIDFGQTMIDPATFMEYIDGLRQSWTAEAYHLLERNCNHFSNELIGFLNGASIPEDILNLPQQFLATPLGASMRPMIDQMFRGTNHPPSAPSQPAPSASLTPAHLLANIASSAYNITTDAPLHSCSTVAALDAQLNEHPCVVVNFTNERGCPPCRAIAPVYEQIAKKLYPTPAVRNPHHRRKRNTKDVSFVKVDTTVSRELGEKYQIRATPTFKFFVNKKEISELKGANPTALETEINLMLFTAYPPHPHLKPHLPNLKALSPEPIQYTQPLNFDKALNKLLESIPAGPASPREVVKQTFEWIVIPFLNQKADLNSPDRFTQWARTTTQILHTLTPTDSFPALDFLRVAVLREEYVDQLLVCPPDMNPIYEAIRVANNYESGGTKLPRPFSLTLLRLLSNALGSVTLADQMVEAETHTSPMLMRFSVGRLLDGDPDVQILSAGVCYGLVSRWAGFRTEWLDSNGGSDGGSEEEWEVELMSALVESLGREEKNASANPEMVHRLIATIGKLWFLSTCSESLKCLLDSLEFRPTLTRLSSRSGLVKVKESIKDLCEEIKRLCSA